MMAKKPEEFEHPSDLEDFYVQTAEFPAGFMTQYTPSLIVGSSEHQDLAAGFPVGKRFKSAPVVRVGDTNPLHLGHHATADGRWRIYVFAEAALPGTNSATDKLAAWFTDSPVSPLAATPAGADPDAWFDLKVIYQQPHTAVDINAVPAAFKPLVGPFKLTDYEKVYATDPKVRGGGGGPSGPVRGQRAAADGNRGTRCVLRTPAGRPAGPKGVGAALPVPLRLAPARRPCTTIGMQPARRVPFCARPPSFPGPGSPAATRHGCPAGPLPIGGGLHWPNKTHATQGTSSRRRLFNAASWAGPSGGALPLTGRTAHPSPAAN